MKDLPIRIIDIETAGLTSDTLVFTISVVGTALSDRINGLDIIADNRIKVLDFRLPVTDQLRHGRTTDPETVGTWLSKQSPKVQKNIELSDVTGGTDVKTALQEIIDFIGDDALFMRGTDFEGSILPSLAKAYGVKWPTRYYQNRDVRTFISAFANDTEITHMPVDEILEDSGLTKHIGLDDCLIDIVHMNEARNQFIRTVESEYIERNSN